MDLLAQTINLDVKAVGAIGTLLLSAIGFLWRQQVEQAKNTETKLNMCQDEHVKANEKFLTLSMELAEVRGRQDGVNDLARQVLEVVSKGKPGD